MTKHFGVGVAVLSALAAEGKNFDREELNAMLDKLAASPEPKVRRGAIAACYVMMARYEAFDYVCKKCGTHTVYPEFNQFVNPLARYRDGVARLRALGLDIVLDESVLCRKCHSAKDLSIPSGAKIAVEPDSEVGRVKFPWKKGDAVAIKSYAADYSCVIPLNPECWISAKYISEKGEVLGNDVRIRYSPSLYGSVFSEVRKGEVLDRLPARQGDPEDWVCLKIPKEWRGVGVMFPTKSLGDFTYEEGDKASLVRFERLAWVINGKRTIARKSGPLQYDDITILEAFLTGKETLDGRILGEKYALKDLLGRLSELLGPVGESDGLAPKNPTPEVSIEVDL